MYVWGRLEISNQFFFVLSRCCCVPKKSGINDLRQEPITRNLQLPHVPVMAFSQTDLFLAWIHLESTSPQEPQWPINLQSQARTNVGMSTCRHDVDMFTWGRIVLSLPKRAHLDWNWPISREKASKHRKCRCIGLLWDLQAPGNGLLSDHV